MQNKTILWILLCIGILYSCSSQKKFINNDELCVFDDEIFTVTKKEMTLDIDKYREHLKKRDTIVKNTDNYKSRFYMYKHGSSIGEVTNKQTNKQANKRW